MMSVVSRAKASGMQRCSLVGGVELRRMHGIERARRAYLSFPILPPIPSRGGLCVRRVRNWERFRQGDEFDRASTKLTLLFQRTYPSPTQADTTSRICSRPYMPFCCPWLARCTEPHGAILRSAISRGSGRLHTVVLG
jgi:hypothetical protein